MSSTIPARPDLPDDPLRRRLTTRLSALQASLQAWLAAFVAHHGAWAPGVRLLRNLSLRGKTLLLGSVVALPLVLFLTLAAWQELEALGRMRQGWARMELIRHGSALQRAVEAWWLAEARQMPAAPPRQALLKAEQAAYAPLAAAVPSIQSQPELLAAWQSLVQRRSLALGQPGHLAATALPGREPPGADAVAAYVEDLLAFRAELARDSGLATEASAGARSLVRLSGLPLSRLHWVLSQTMGIGLPLQEHPDSPDRQARARRLMLVSARGGVMLQDALPEFERAVSQTMVDRPVIDRLRIQVQAHMDRALERGSELAALPVDALAGPAAIDAFLASGRGAVQALDAAEDAAMAGLQAYAEARDRSEHRRYGIVATLLALWLLLALYLLASAYRVLAGGLETLCRHLVRLGQGDLSQRPAGYGKDEIGSALKALGSSMGRMSELFGAVTQGVAAVSQASREVAAGNVGLSSRTGDVRSLISGVADRAEACSHALDSCGGQVERTAELMVDMRADGERGRKAMSGMRESMARLQGKSRQISQVVGLVESLAYQTRLLSINASVEAARAGPAGRGFSVVAHEVRALALRSEQAAQRIGGIVAGSIEEIELGVTLSERADEAVRRNEEKMEAVNSLMREAVTLTRTGRSESQEVLAISRTVEESVAGNVRVIDQLAQASASLRSQGDNLKRSVQHFVFD